MTTQNLSAEAQEFNWLLSQFSANAPGVLDAAQQLDECRADGEGVGTSRRGPGERVERDRAGRQPGGNQLALWIAANDPGRQAQSNDQKGRVALAGELRSRT